MSVTSGRISDIMGVALAQDGTGDLQVVFGVGANVKNKAWFFDSAPINKWAKFKPFINGSVFADHYSSTNSARLAALIAANYGDELFDLLTAGLDLTNWNDKSIAQINKLQNALAGLKIPDEILNLIEDEAAREALVKAFNALIKAASDKGENVKPEKRASDIRRAAREFNSLAQSIAGFASAAGNNNLAGIATALGSIVDTGAQAAESFIKGRPWDGVLTIVNGVVSAIFNAATATAEFNAQLEKARADARRQGFSDMLTNGVDSIFGSNEMAKVRNAASVIEKLRREMGGVDGSKRVTYTSGFFDNLFGTTMGNKSLGELAEELGMDLYDTYGNLNAQTLQKILDTYKGLGTEQEAWIRKAIDDSETYKEALVQLDGTLESLFGGIASSAADTIVDQWAEAGNAALDYADILDDVARSYAKMITQSLLLDTVFTPEFKEKLQSSFVSGDTQGAMDLILGGLQQMQAMAPEIATALEPLRPYLQTGAGAETDTLSSGISKELVEGNSSLIASYMNAMRADLSVMRALQTAGWQDVSIIREYTPTLAEYTAQIAANTFDTAQASQAILSKLQSIITPSTNGGNAVRTTR